LNVDPRVSVHSFTPTWFVIIMIDQPYGQNTNSAQTYKNDSIYLPMWVFLIHLSGVG